MVLLEDRLWSGVACGPRMVFTPSAIIAICLAALVRIAPRAMQKFAEWITDQGRSLPVQLIDLLSK